MSEAAASDASAQAGQEIRAQRIRLRPGRRGTTNSDNDLEEQLPILLAVIGLVLLIARANVADLIPARGTSRE